MRKDIAILSWRGNHVVSAGYGAGSTGHGVMSVSIDKTDLSLIRIRYAIEFMNESEQDCVVRLVEMVAGKIMGAGEKDICHFMSPDMFDKPQRYDA